MGTLLVNNNNSRTKFALASETELKEHRVADTPGLDASVLEQTLAGWSWDRVVLASVVPQQAARVLVPWLEETTKYQVLEVSNKIELGIEVDFPQPETVGADRLANAAAVVGLRPTAVPAIVVDFGTAVTFDIIAPCESGAAYIGGVIAPGLDVMRDYLHQRTALLPKIDLSEPPAAIGKSTIDAMLSGAVYGYRGLVREIIAQISEEISRDFPEASAPKLIATGGYADLIAAGLPEIEEVCPYLTIDGLRIIAALNAPFFT